MQGIIKIRFAAIAFLSALLILTLSLLPGIAQAADKDEGQAVKAAGDAGKAKAESGKKAVEKKKEADRMAVEKKKKADAVTAEKKTEEATPGSYDKFENRGSGPLSLYSGTDIGAAAKAKNMVIIRPKYSGS